MLVRAVAGWFAKRAQPLAWLPSVFVAPSAYRRAMEQVVAEMGSVWPGYSVLTPAGLKKVVRVGRTPHEFIYEFEDGTHFITASGMTITITRG